MRTHARSVAGAALAIALVFGATVFARYLGTTHRDGHRPAPAGTVTVPESSTSRPGDAGVRGHSNVEVFVPGALGPLQPPAEEFYRKENPPKPDKSTGPAGGSQR